MFDLVCKSVLLHMLLHSISSVVEYDSNYILGFVINLETLDCNKPCKILISCFFRC